MHWIRSFRLKLVMGLVVLSLCPVSLNAAVVRLQMDQEQYVGGEFRVDIMVKNVRDLYGLALDLKYDPDTLEVVDNREEVDGIQPKIKEGSLLDGNGTWTTLLGAAMEDGKPGTIVIGLSRSGLTEGVTSEAETVFVSVFFRPKATGTTNFTLNRQGLKDPQNQDLPLTLGEQLALTIEQKEWTADVDHSGDINLTDTILVLKAYSHQGDENIFLDSDVNSDQKIGFAEAITVLKKEAATEAP